MTSMTPRGPLTPAVYWRRRVFVLGVVAALLLIAVNLVRGNDGSPGPAAVRAATAAGESTSAPSAAPSLDATSTSATEGKGTKKGGGKKGATTPPAPVYTPPPPPPLIDPVGSCTDDDIALSPDVSGAVAGRTVTITLRLRTLAAEACTWRVSANHLTFKITQGEDEIWTSRECPGKLPKDSVVVRRDVTSTYDLTWNSRQSDVGCPKLTAFAQPGDYDIEVAAYGGEPASSSFTLAAPSAVVPESPFTAPDVAGESGAGVQGDKAGEGKQAQGKSQNSGKNKSQG